MQEDGNGNAAVTDQRTWRGYAQVALIVLVLAVAWYFARAPREDPAPGDVAVESASAARPVAEVVRPRAEEQALTVHLTGTVSLEERTTVVSAVTGRVVWVSPDYTAGGAIAAGEPLLRLDPAAYELAVASAQAAVDGASARVWLEELQAAEAVDAFLLAEPDGEPSAWIQRLPHLALARAELASAEAALGLAELRLSQTSISFPYDVRVMATDMAVGEWVDPGDPVHTTRLGVVYRPDALHVAVPIEPGDLAYLEPVVGRAVQVTGRMGSWEAEVVGVSSLINPTSRLTTVFIGFPSSGPADALPLPGTFVEIAIEGPAFVDAYMLPNTVLQDQGRVWVVRDGRLERFEPEEHGRTDTGWVVQAFDVGEGVVTGALPGAREGLEVSAQAVETP